MGSPKRQQDFDCLSYGDYLGWPEDERYELIAGRAYAMTPAPTVTHQKVVGAIHRQLAEALDDSPCEVLIAPVDVLLPQGEEADEEVATVVQPDLLVVCDPAKVDERRVRGAPDWIIEVLSSATAARDQIRKRDLYERHGVREYWLVHPTDRVVVIYRREDSGFGKSEVAEMAGNSAARAIPGVSIDWGRVTRRLPR